MSLFEKIYSFEKVTIYVKYFKTNYKVSNKIKIYNYDIENVLKI